MCHMVGEAWEGFSSKRLRTSDLMHFAELVLISEPKHLFYCTYIPTYKNNRNVHVVYCAADMNSITRNSY